MITMPNFDVINYGAFSLLKPQQCVRLEICRFNHSHTALQVIKSIYLITNYNWTGGHHNSKSLAKCLEGSEWK